MAYRITAELVLVLHFLFIVFVVAGGLLVLWRPRALWVHLPLLVWGTVVSLAGWICPLTPLENRLRAAGGAAEYDGTFLEQYLAPVIYPQGWSRDLALAAGLLLPIWNVLVYVWVWRRLSRRRSGSSSPDRSNP